jgi:cytidine deaminase
MSQTPASGRFAHRWRPALDAFGTRAAGQQWDMADDTDARLTRLITTAAGAATAARSRAYAPYSNFKMGAAAVSADGDVIDGVLVENVSLGLAMCAERVALFASVTAGTRPVVLALCSKRTDSELTFPCGACLQVALEIAGPDLTVVAVDPDGEKEHARLGTLLTRAPSRKSPDFDA